MKYKIWFRLSTISVMWIFVTVLLYSFLGLMIVSDLVEDRETLHRFVNNEMSTTFITVMSIGCIFAVSILLSFILSLSIYANKLDDLDKAIEECQELKIKLRNKINNIINQ